MFDPKQFDIKKYDAILSKGLSYGLGNRKDQVCIEAAICQVLGLPHGDDPGCVSDSVRSFKIVLNDSAWSNSKARAAGLRDLGLAQLGSKDVVSDREFSQRLVKKIIQVLIPTLFRELFFNTESCLQAAARCQLEGTAAAARAAATEAKAAYAATEATAAYAAEASARAADAATLCEGTTDYAAAWCQSEGTAASARAAEASARAAARAADKYLILGAKLALEVLRELKSPGIELLDK